MPSFLFFWVFFEGRQCEIDLSWALGSIPRSLMYHLKVELLSFVLLFACLGTGDEHNELVFVVSFYAASRVGPFAEDTSAPSVLGPTVLDALDSACILPVSAKWLLVKAIFILAILLC